MKIADCTYISKIFWILDEKVGNSKRTRIILRKGQQKQHHDLGIFMSFTMKAATHLSLNYEKNMEVLKCRNFENVGNLLTFIENLVTKTSREILNVRTIDYRLSCWTESTLAHDQVKKSKAKVRVYSDSALCLGKEAEEKWSNQLNEFKMYCAADEFYGIDREAI